MMIAYAIAGGCSGLAVIGLASFLIYYYCCLRSGCRRRGHLINDEGNTFSFNDEIEVKYSTKSSNGQGSQGSQGAQGGRMAQMSGLGGKLNSIRGSQMSGVVRGSQMSNFSGFSSY